MVSKKVESWPHSSRKEHDVQSEQATTHMATETQKGRLFDWK